MKSKSQYNKKIAECFHDIRYYECSEYDIKNQKFLKSEKNRLKTNKKEKMSNFITREIYLDKNINNNSKIFSIMENIYEKNKKHIFNNDINNYCENHDLMSLVSNISLLIVSYAKIRKNPGNTTLAHTKTDSEYEKLDQEQKDFLNKNQNDSMDGINFETFQVTSKLLKDNKYPWGTSKRIYINKSEKPGEKRPIIIPSFMDKVVQEAVKQILLVIYEPVFDKMHISFGFRPNRRVHDAIYSLTSLRSTGLDKALEGDFKNAYSNSNRKRLILFLSKRIKDKKFLKLIETRMKYEFYDSEKDIYVKHKDSIPQSGTDSPYLWNIYMLEFDVYITTIIHNWVYEKNIKRLGKNPKQKRILNKQRSTQQAHKRTILRILNVIRLFKNNKGSFREDLIRLSKLNLNKWVEMHPSLINLKNAKSVLKLCNIEQESEINIIKILQKEARKIQHKLNNLPFLDINSTFFRIIYVRFAYDWIILTNLKISMLEELKKIITIYVKDNLNATLSDEKTLITRLKFKPAYFLGFEIKAYRKMKIQMVKKTEMKSTMLKIAENRVFAGVDRQRLINILQMKGYCYKNGFPREIPKLNNLEVFTIIDKTNSVLLGLTNYYVNFIKNPKSSLSRWIYLIRFSCLKTLAQKYKTTITNVLDEFRPEHSQTGADTIEYIVIIEINGHIYQKKWRLLTIQDLMLRCRKKKQPLQKNRCLNLTRNQSVAMNFDKKTKNLNIKSDDFLERINWVNIRTKDSFNLPCFICGTDEKVEMHHVNYVRKTKYDHINQNRTWQQVMGIRNTRQIPVCKDCYKDVIRTGKYKGEKLNLLSIDKLYDNSRVNVESYINKGDPNFNYSKTLIEKGWILIKDKGNV